MRFGNSNGKRKHCSKNGNELNEIELAKLETPEKQSLNLMPLLETNCSWRNEQTAGMDIQGNTYGNAIEYSFVTDPFGTEEYSTCDAWYLGKIIQDLREPGIFLQIRFKMDLHI